MTGSAQILVELPTHLRALARVDRQVNVEVQRPVTLTAVLNALEHMHPALCGTIRDRTGGARRPLIRFFGCGEDLSHSPMDQELPVSIVNGNEPLIVLGAIAGG